ncbi:MAG: L-histidine N(alpha)-methyltransferase [Myxococcales bacterium]|nr:L-histidine N(alpha)-methyltransferase [Myxococcales bacterium]
MISPAQPAARRTDLATHVLEGLSAPQKFLSSLWFYDDEGSRLFQEIMALPEYYLTRLEHQLLDERADELVGLIASEPRPIDLLELGSGDGAKTVTLLAALHRAHPACVFHPMDISRHALDELVSRVNARVPELAVAPVCGDYFLAWPETTPDHRQVAMFLGSNLGNFDGAGAEALLGRIRGRLRGGDLLVLGVDLIKDPAVILSAYNDPQGVTARFNLNVLRRLNRELDMDFDLTTFRHYPTYSPLDGAARSFLISTRAQVITSRVLGRSFELGAGEAIYTEQSQKYSRASIERLAAATGFAVKAFVTDPREWYALVVCRTVAGPTATP